MPAEFSHLRATVESITGLWWGPRRGRIRLRPLNMTDSARGTIGAQRTRGKFKPRMVANMGTSARPGSRPHAERSPSHQNPAAGGTRPRLPPACCLRLEKQAINAANRSDRNGLAPPPPGQPGAFEASACSQPFVHTSFSDLSACSAATHYQAEAVGRLIGSSGSGSEWGRGQFIVHVGIDQQGPPSR